MTASDLEAGTQRGHAVQNGTGNPPSKTLCVLQAKLGQIISTSLPKKSATWQSFASQGMGKWYGEIYRIPPKEGGALARQSKDTAM
jgi:hypothetical protein